MFTVIESGPDRAHHSMLSAAGIGLPDKMPDLIEFGVHSFGSYMPSDWVFHHTLWLPQGNAPGVSALRYSERVTESHDVTWWHNQLKATVNHPNLGRLATFIGIRQERTLEGGITEIVTTFPNSTQYNRRAAELNQYLQSEHQLPLTEEHPGAIFAGEVTLAAVKKYRLPMADGTGMREAKHQPPNAHAAIHDASHLIWWAAMPKSVLDATIQAFSDTYTWPTAEQRVGGIDASLSTSVIGALARGTYFSDLAKPEQYRYRMMTTPDPEDDRFPARTSYDIKPHVAEINRALATMLAHLPLQTELALESANHGE